MKTSISKIAVLIMLFGSFLFGSVSATSISTPSIEKVDEIEMMNSIYQTGVRITNHTGAPVQVYINGAHVGYVLAHSWFDFPIAFCGTYNVRAVGALGSNAFTGYMCGLGNRLVVSPSFNFNSSPVVIF